MQTELQRRFDEVERQRAALKTSALALSDTQLNWTPGPDTWSVRQIVQHLVLSDETVGRARDTHAIEPEARMFRVLPRALRRRLVLSAFQHNLVLPLPSPNVQPREDVPLPALLARWDKARDEMRRVLDTLRPSETRYAHPVLGPLTATQMLELEQAHTAYHMRQKDKVQSLAGFPRRLKL